MISEVIIPRVDRQAWGVGGRTHYSTTQPHIQVYRHMYTHVVHEGERERGRERGRERERVRERERERERAREREREREREGEGELSYKPQMTVTNQKHNYNSIRNSTYIYVPIPCNSQYPQCTCIIMYVYCDFAQYLDWTLLCLFCSWQDYLAW